MMRCSGLVPIGKTAVALVVGLLWLVGVLAGATKAQEIAWQEPVRISNSPIHSLFPSLVVDASGIVHVVWCEALDEPQANTIFYARYDGREWSSPIDIHHFPGQRARAPVLAIDDQGYLHLVWEGRYGDQAVYSQAFAPDAGVAQAWSEPEGLGEPLAFTRFPDITVGPDGAPHVVWAVFTGEGSGVYYSTRRGDGTRWREPSLVWDSRALDRTVDQPRLAVDDGGGIHVVWTETKYPETFPALGIRYARSTDGGATWSEPTRFDGPYSLGGLLTTGEMDLVVVWSGTDEDRQKFFTRSTDRGETWSPSGWTVEVGGLQGWPSLAEDSGGGVHLVQVQGTSEDVGLVHQVWDGEGWSAPTRLVSRSEGAPNHPTNPDVAIGLGNQVHVVVSHMIESPPGSGLWWYEIYYRQGQAAAPRTEPQTLRATEVTSGPDVAAPTPAATASPTERPETKIFKVAPPPDTGETESNFLRPILAGVVPALVLAGAVLVWQMRRR